MFNIYGEWVSDGAIYHHGILGMKWGKRNGPPYPLSPGDRSASEKKAGWRKSLDDAKSDYKDKKKAYKAAKSAYSAGNIRKAADKRLARQYKRQYKDAIKNYKEARAEGNKGEAKTAKADRDYFKAEYKSARLRAKAQLKDNPVLKMSLEKAKEEYDLSKQRLKLEKEMAGVDFKSRINKLFSRDA